MAPKNLTLMSMPQLVEHIEAQIAQQTALSKPEAIRLNSVHNKAGKILALNLELIQEPLTVTLGVSVAAEGLQNLRRNLWRVACYIGDERRLKVQLFETNDPV